MESGNSSITFRLKDRAIDDLKKHSEEEGISLNNLVNKVLDSYLEWECFAPKVGFVPMQKYVLKTLFDSLPEEQIKEIAIQSADSFEDELLIMRGKVDLDAVLSLTKGRVKRSGFALSVFDDDVENSKMKKLIIQHEMGRNWSVFSKTYIERLLNNVDYAVKADSTDSSLTIEISDVDRPAAYTRQVTMSSLDPRTVGRL